MSNHADLLKSIIQSRRSVFPKSYRKQEIEDALIRDILESAIYAPNHKRTEPWRFVVFKGQGKIRLANVLAKTYKQQVKPEVFLEKKYNSFLEKAEQAGCMVAIVASFHPDKLPEWEEIAAIGCAMQNVALSVTANGLGGYWSSPGVISGLGALLNLEQNEKCVGIFYMGYYDEAPRGGLRTPIERKLTWIKD